MSALKQGEITHGFQLVHTGDIHEIRSKAYVFEHVKSGAKLLYLQNDDDNKVFTISFRTPPEDNTGVFHILEHSVLCGSDKYPVKEPFVELLKGSLNTFLNAFTFSDKTMYPVASKNDKDFMNLMDVYMDAVFHPNIYKHKEILEQEGWHYELIDTKEAINYKGVVYNEMKGAFSSPEGLLERANQNSLFPDTAYGFESGGDPLSIPDLTYDQFINTHKKYYSPANSYIYLYGAMDISEKLAYLDQNYLSTFDKIEVDSSVAVQPPIGNSVEIVKDYPILPGEDAKDKTYMSINFAVSKATDAETYLAFDILDYLLLDSPAAPLKKAILDAGIGQDVFGSYDNSTLQPHFSINVKNSNEDKKDAFKKVVFDTLRQFVSSGLDKKQIEAAISVKEFQLREADYGSMPKGLVYSMAVMDSWLYDGDPLIHLKFEDSLSKIKQALTSNYFEGLIEKYLLNSRHQSFVTIRPSRTLAEEEASQTAEKLADYKKSLSKEALDQLVTETKNLKERQSSKDQPEDLRKIPLLSLNDVDKKAEEIPRSETEIDGVKTLFHDLATNKIAYVSLYFDASGVPEAYIPYLSLLQETLGKVDTDKYTYSDLVSEINIQTGGVGFDNQSFADKESDEIYKPRFAVRTKILTDKLPEAFDLLHEILFHSRFDNPSRLKEIIKEMKSRLEMAFNQGGQSVAARRLASYFSRVARYREQLKGLRFYQFICELDKDLDGRFDEIHGALAELAGQLFTEDRLVVSITGDQPILQAVRDHFERLNIPPSGTDEKTVESGQDGEPSSQNEGLMTSSKVQYVTKGANFKTLGFEYSGKMHVLKRILTLDYLWNHVRVMGGAYGCGVMIESSGNLIYWSYRDPNLDDTLKIYDRAGAYAESFDADDREMTKYIIGTISSLDAPLTPRDKADQSDAEYFRRVTQADIQRVRDDVLATTEEDIRQFAPLLNAVAGENHICVFGSEATIKKNKDLFGQCINVFE
ncbi:insulinase family protein [Sporolactobacillus putidus]|uniref:Peptidase M16 n=1 Tax=Sporolactobacillus putidus TaxID=492735 RepID=A0A917S2U0_9BACL|nr:insulinase family protein [Sporolactobacillus putidus]GGL51560.1 peptidase M16 [Sporolactobacillus putidus]